MDSLWSRQTTAGLAPQGNRAQAGRLNAEVGYGFAPFESGLVTPYAGTVLADGDARTYRVGTRWRSTERWAGFTGLALSVEGVQEQSAGGSRTYRVGTRLQVQGHGFRDLALTLEALRQPPAGQQPGNQALQLQAEWGF